MKPCKKCCCSGWYVDYGGYPEPVGVLMACKACDGKGWIEGEVEG